MRIETMLALLLLVNPVYSADIIADISESVAIKAHVSRNVFIESEYGLGVGYGYQYKDGLFILSANEHGSVKLYGSFKPRTMLYQVGATLERGKNNDTDSLQLEYTYFINRNAGFVIKYHTRKQWFIGVRKWL